jgi:hypothetical protein
MLPQSQTHACEGGCGWLVRPCLRRSRRSYGKCASRDVKRSGGSSVRRRRRYGSTMSFFSLFIRPRAHSQGQSDRKPVHPERSRRLRSVPSATPIRCVWSVNAQGSGLPEGPSIGREAWLTCRQPARLGPWYPHRTRTRQGAATDTEPAHHSRVRPWHRDMQREPVPMAP